MTTQEAKRIVGNQSLTCLRNMVIALQLCPRLNTHDDNARLEAAQIVLKNSKPRRHVTP
ncbi:hypothetical protein [Telmatospirillum sp.]|uniref:hypothetical protein n=1 Tax=Telmatospirillum sp. TaxID=2079197 RepID=UPI0028452892|nr:hypothetical protein [Telmatospirillum sp.]MDR3436408.1 hypothetical protein [Telmatospirillum sp.]